MEDKTREEQLAEAWKKLDEAAKEVSEKGRVVTAKEAGTHGKHLNEYIRLLSGQSSIRAIVNWLSVGGYKISEASYSRITRSAKNEAISPLNGDGVTLLCYVISKKQNCSPKYICDMLITLGLFTEGTLLKQYIIDKLRDDDEKKETLISEQMKECVSNDQDNHDSPGNGVDYMKSLEGSTSDRNSKIQNRESFTFTDRLLGAEDTGSQKNDADDSAGLSVGYDKCKMDSIEDDAENVQPNKTQHTDQDNALEITKEGLEKFVIEFIGAMSIRMEARFLEEPSSHSALFTICENELPIFHPDIEAWEYVRVTYFASDIADEDVQQEIELIHKLKKCSDAFVIVACATDGIFKRVRDNIACNGKNSIMLLCYEHPDEAYICLKKHSKSDKKCFEFFKPDSQKYFYM